MAFMARDEKSLIEISPRLGTGKRWYRHRGDYCTAYYQSSIQVSTIDMSAARFGAHLSGIASKARVGVVNGPVRPVILR